ncbi:hypothetical protein HK103_003402 [Boothiomyces macroporosus]|uniref:Uncharacterized protein n=1 Tax=Boothiomyces macroporosus TaxID=261099 RepID=A0AAD5Y431_9FUNG|nr:hypothetical protein HK103_003402 [Boothiomyces macroporosus]
MQYRYKCPSPYAITQLHSSQLKEAIYESLAALPKEIIELIINMISGKDLVRHLQSKWEPLKDVLDLPSKDWHHFNNFKPPEGMQVRFWFDNKVEQFKLSVIDDVNITYQSVFENLDLYRFFSAPDFCYRTLCFFPGINVNSGTTYNIGEKYCWYSYLIHQDTGYAIELIESEGASQISYYYVGKKNNEALADRQKLLKFAADIVELLNAYLDCNTYYHPGAVIVHKPNLERYITEPKLDFQTSNEEHLQERIFAKFASTAFSPAFLEKTIPFKCTFTLKKLQLGFVIPSALLFYALLSGYTMKDIKPFINQKIIGVWSVCLVHRATRTRVILMDANGFASARIEKDENTLCSFDLNVLLDWICSGRSLHPAGFVNGSAL